jgi:hypothetical protein
MKIWDQISIRKIGRQILGNHPFSRIVSFSSIQYSCVFYFVNFVIDIMFKNKYETNKILEKYLVKHPLFPTFASTWVNPVFLWGPCSYFSCLLFDCVCTMSYPNVGFVSGLPILACPQCLLTNIYLTLSHIIT